MPSMADPMVSVTLQAVVMSGVSNILSQAITAYRKELPFQIDWMPVIHFALFSLVMVPPNFLWQRFLEDSFPAYPEDSSRTTKDKPERQRHLSVANTAIKLGLDQTLAAPINTALFLAAMTGLGGASSAEIIEVVQRDFLQVIISGLKLWPLVSLLLFTVVPFKHRMLVGGMVNFAWSIYLSLVAAQA